MMIASDVIFGRFADDCLSVGVSYAMDLYKALQDLYAEKEKLERAIASLEELQRMGGGLPGLPQAGKRRGRKSMSAEERVEVSRRMRKYWAARRKQKPEGPTPKSQPRERDS